MTLKKRYSLIVLGILIFFITAPLLIMGIRGYIYDFSNNKFIKTGILVAKTAPKKAIITLTGREKYQEESNHTFRFLLPGDYLVEIKKEGFFDWNKMLTVRGGLVTSIAANTNYLYLIPKKPEKIKESKEFKNTLDKIDSGDYYFKSELEKLSLIKKEAREEKMIIENLPVANQKQIYVFKNGLIFIILDKNLYQLVPQNNGSEFEARLNYITAGVDFIQWDKTLESFIYGNAHEVSLYNPFKAGESHRELLIRTAEPGESFCFMPEIGYLFRVYEKKIKAIELDGRHNRNAYNLFENLNNPKIIDCDQGQLTILEAGIYKTYQIKLDDSNILDRVYY